MADATSNPEDRLQQMRQWLSQAQAGDRNALDWLLLSSCEVIRERAEYLFARKFRFLQQRGHDVDSIVSDVWLKLKRHFQEKLPTSIEHLTAILALSVHHMLLDKAGMMRRRDSREKELASENLSGQGHAHEAGDNLDPQALAEFGEFQKRLWTRLSALPEDEQRVFEMHYFLGLTQARIAEDLNLHPRQVSRLWVKASSAVVLGLKEE